MTRSRALVLLTSIALLASVAETWLVGRELPAHIATTFASDGTAVATMPKSAALAVSIVVLVTIVSLLSLAPFLFRRLPHAFVNLPHRDHWLAPERRDATLAALTTWSHGFTCATTLFLVWVQHLVLTANRAPQPRLPASFPWILGFYLLGTFFACYRLWSRFRRPASATSREQADATH